MVANITFVGDFTNKIFVTSLFYNFYKEDRPSISIGRPLLYNLKLPNQLTITNLIIYNNMDIITKLKKKDYRPNFK